jgi:FlaA1/EpsC-like NDP-sugar epimerase
MSSLRQSATALRSSVTARRAGQLAVDACLLGLAYYLAYYLRFDDGIPRRYENLLEETIVLTVAMKVVIFAMFGLYSKLWRFVDQKDFEAILKAVVASTVAVIVVLFLFSIGRHDPPRSVVALDFLLSLVFVSGARFAVRALVERPQRGPFLERAAHEVLIVGAGNGGQQVAFELRRWATWTTIRASRACASPATRCSARPTSSRACWTV